MQKTMQYISDPELLSFQDSIKAFLRDKLPVELRQAGRKATSVFAHPDISLEWQAILHKQGWVAPDWPEEFGGTGWTEIERYIFAAECAFAGAPSLAPMGLKMVAPVIMHYGTSEQKSFYLPRILIGEDYWCQGFSEPGSGSDLASLKLSARRDGDDYVLNGSKIWTTHAQFANQMFCLVRTSNKGRLQTGITFLLIDMLTPGISVDPIITMSGDHELNQVFFDSVHVPVCNILGEEHDGWTVAKYLLNHERGGRYAPALMAHLDQISASIDSMGLAKDPSLNEERTRISIELKTLQAIEMKAMIEGQEQNCMLPSVLKILGSEISQRIDHFGMRLTGTAGLFPPEKGASDFVAKYLNNRASTIYAGTNEVQRDIVARQLLST